MEINWELIDLGKLKEGGYRDIAFKHSLAFVNTLESTNKLVALHHLTPLPISENSTTLED